MECLVTVVVPIYNVERYLERCINSIVNQTYKNLEIILVDDGSPDNCPQICDMWAAKDSRIKVIHKKNAGLGMARNTGIENATGDYICFFDSDDYVREDTIELCVNDIKKYNVDVVCFGFSRVNKNGIVKSDVKACEEKIIYTGEYVQDYFLPRLIMGEYNGILFSACCMALSMRTVKKYKFRFVSERQIISEDVYSLTELVGYVDSVSVLTESLYFYCENQDSLTKTYRKDRIDKLFEFYENIRQLLTRFNYNDLMSIAIAQVFISFIVAALKQTVHSGLTNKEINKILYNTVSNKNLINALNMIKKKKNSFKRKILYFSLENKLIYISKILLRH